MSGMRRHPIELCFNVKAPWSESCVDESDQPLFILADTVGHPFGLLVW